MSEANNRQVAGNHYRQAPGVPQHWDLVSMYEWDYFQSQITKYLMRWKDKWPTPEQRYDDLQKGFHFYQKYLEVWKIFDHLPAAHVLVPTRTEEDIDREWEAQLEARSRFHEDGFDKDGGRYQCAACRLVINANSPLNAHQKHSLSACQGGVGKAVHPAQG